MVTWHDGQVNPLRAVSTCLASGAHQVRSDFARILDCQLPLRHHR